MLSGRVSRSDWVAVVLREAKRSELVDIVRLLADDPLGSTREHYADPLPAGYTAAFDAIENDVNNELLVAKCGDRLAGVLQLTYLPNLTFRGRWRAQIEGVRVAPDFRGQGVGRLLISGAVEKATIRGCHVVQLTTNRVREDAQSFYSSLGFEATHVGFKRSLAAAEVARYE